MKYFSPVTSMLLIDLVGVGKIAKLRGVVLRLSASMSALNNALESVI